MMVISVDRDGNERGHQIALVSIARGRKLRHRGVWMT